MMKKLALAAICLAYHRERDGAGRQNRDRQRAESVGQSHIHHVLGVGEGRGVPAVRSQRRRDDLPGHARSDAADHQLRPRHRSAAPDVAPHGRDEQHRAGGSTTVTPGTFFQQVTPQQADLSQPWADSLELYITPWGFLKGAAENNATASRGKADGKSYTVLSWSPEVKAPSGKNYTINGYLNDQNLIERVETWLGDNIMGDMHILAVYSGWKDFGGAMAPAKIVQTRGGWPFFEADVDGGEGESARFATLAPAPADRSRPVASAAGGGSARGAAVTSEKLGDGLYRLTTGAGSYDSLIVEFRDHIMMLEAGQSEARALAYIAEAKKLIPNKPIRYVMNTHPHSDHTGGLPALVAEGATIITHQNNQEFFERALNTPRTLLTDSLAKNPKKAVVDPVADKKVYTDGTRIVEMYHIYPTPHSNGLLVASSRRRRCCSRATSRCRRGSRPTIT